MTTQSRPRIPPAESCGAVGASVGVIIPYFQRRPGLLARALAAVLAQRGAGAAAIIVIDDGSPAPARQELAGFDDADRARIILIEQVNGGVSAARNRGLAALPATVDTIAFLDSDDIWPPDHLAVALSALRQGADFYFADHLREAAGQSRFSECGIIADPAAELPCGRQIYWFEGDLFATILRKSPIGTSTVVFRRAIAPALRFRTELSQREDALFWMSIMHPGARVAFSTAIRVSCGIGVNIFASATWSTPAVLKMLLHLAMFHRIVPRTFTLSPELLAWNTAWLRHVRRDFARNLVSLMRHRRRVDWGSVGRFIRLDPLVIGEIALVPFHLASRIGGR